MKARAHRRGAFRRVCRPGIRHKFLLRCAEKFSWLMWCRARPFPELARLIEHEDRATRSDLIEGLCLVVYCLLSRMDLRSLRVGWRRAWRRNGRVHDFVGLPRETIARWCNLSESTVSRALTILRRAGLVHGPARDGVNHIPQPVDLDGEGYHPMPAVRRFSELFFVGLHEAHSLHELRSPPGTPHPRPNRGGVHPSSAARLIATLANAHAVERPPDG